MIIMPVGYQNAISPNIIRFLTGSRVTPQIGINQQLGSLSLYDKRRMAKPGNF
jgi:hypothetical protein